MKQGLIGEFDGDAKSLPVRECGLKRLHRRHQGRSLHVTPHMGVWIETRVAGDFRKSLKSLPIWECGLKHRKRERCQRHVASLPMWECGLKRVVKQFPDFITFVRHHIAQNENQLVT